MLFTLHGLAMVDAVGCTLLRVLHGGHTKCIRHVVLSPNGTRMASYADDNRVVVWDAITGRCLCVHAKIRCVGFVHMALSPTGEQLAFGDIYCYRIVSNSTHALNVQPPYGARCIVWTPDGTGVMYGCDYGIVERWAVATGQRVWQAQHHPVGVKSMAVALVGQTGASASRDGTVRLWRTDDGQLLRTMLTNDWVSCLAFAPDGQRMAIAMHHGTIEVWDVAAGQPVRELRGNTDIVRRMVFTPCGQRVISDSWDRTVWIWDMATGQLQHIVAMAPPHSIEDIGLAPDGAVMVATSRGTDVVLWRIPPAPDAAVSGLCNNLIVASIIGCLVLIYMAQVAGHLGAAGLVLRGI